MGRSETHKAPRQRHMGSPRIRLATRDYHLSTVCATALAFRQAEFCGPDFLFGMETQMVTNIALEFVAFAVPRFFKCYGVCKRPARIEHRTYGSREYLVVDLSFELLDDVIVQKILTDHKDNAHRRCDKKIHKSRIFKKWTFQSGLGRRLKCCPLCIHQGDKEPRFKERFAPMDGHICYAFDICCIDVHSVREIFDVGVYHFIELFRMKFFPDFFLVYGCGRLDLCPAVRIGRRGRAPLSGPTDEQFCRTRISFSMHWARGS